MKIIIKKVFFVFFFFMLMMTTINFACFAEINTTPNNALTLSAKTLEKIDIVYSINKKVHESIKYGGGLEGGPSAKQVLAYGEGHCGDFTYLMLRELRKIGIKARIVGVRSAYKDAGHSVVEVQINGNWYIFDPTLNVYYLNDIQELIDKPDLVENMYGTPSLLTVYTTKDFFANAIRIIYEYSTDYRDTNISSIAAIVSETDFVTGYELEKMVDNDKKTFAAASSFSLPQSFTLNFESIQEFGRVKIEWYSNTIYGQDFVIEYFELSNNKFKKIVEETNYVDSNNDGIYEHILQESIKTNKVRFTLVNSYEQSRLLIREFMLFE